jgi:hypothetical protein
MKNLASQYSSGSKIVVLVRSASVIIQIRSPLVSLYADKMRKPSRTASSFSLLIFGAEIPPISRQVTRQELQNGIARRVNRFKRTGRRHEDRAETEPCPSCCWIRLSVACYQLHLHWKKSKHVCGFSHN